MKYLNYFLYIIFAFSINISKSKAQSITKINGTVIDAQTKLPLAFVDVYLIGTNVGVSTDDDGKFNIETRFPSDTIVARFLGYKDQKVRIIKGSKQTINFSLEDESLKLETIVVKTKRERYSKKNNPAVDLARKAMANKSRNNVKSRDFVSYDKYEKVRIDLNNITEKFKNRALVRDFDFVWNYIDTSEINGRTFLPIFMREMMSTVYFRKDPKVERERRSALKYTELSESMDTKSMNSLIELLYQDIDIYDDRINLLDQVFLSPLAESGINFYRYYIIDTTIVDDKSLINLAFIPAVKGNFGFVGNMYITNDGKFSVTKVDFGIVDGINLNFVRDVKISQEFETVDTSYVKTKDELIIDYSLTQNSLGAYGNRTVYYTNFSFEEAKDRSKYDGLEKIIDEPDMKKTEEYWQSNRVKPLADYESGVYDMVDSLRQNRRYRTYKYIGKVFAYGYIPAGPIEFGPLATFFSFNEVEGNQYRFGGGTTSQFSKKIRLQGYGSYVTRTKIWKYSSGLTYTFNDDYKTNPRHYIKLNAERSAYFPGQDLSFFSPDNFLLSFRRGSTTNMILSDRYQASYVEEHNGYSYETGLSYKKRNPYGTLVYQYQDLDGENAYLSDITTSELYFNFKYAPNEKIIQSKDSRIEINTKFPIIKLYYAMGFKNKFGGDYNYHRISLAMSKQAQWKTLGTSNLLIETGKIFGEIPYILNFIPTGNQSYAYQFRSFNMMNFMEFAVDQFASVKFEHFFNGYIFNRIPLLKKIKLRETFSVRALYGSLTEKNNPELNPNQIQFPITNEGISTTYTLGNMPYMEASVGITNLFKVLRLDLVKRLNYLDNPNLATLFGKKGMGIRGTFMVEF